MKNYIDLEDMANANCSRILNLIQQHEVLSRKQIVALSELSWGGMTKIVNRLLESGAIVEEKAGAASGGRIPGMLRVNHQKNFAVGLDINRSGLRAIVMNLSGEILKRYAQPVKAPDDGKALLEEILAFAASVSHDFEPGLLVSVGIAMQGLIDSAQGISIAIPGVRSWNHVPIKALLEQIFQARIFLEHDPDCLLYAHLKQTKEENLLLLRIDKSIGMAASIEGRILKGTGILELAHNIVIPGGRKCSCGAHGCLEAYIRPCMAQGKYHMNAVSELLLPLAVSIKNMGNLFHADKVILTGDLMTYHERFEAQLKEKLKEINCPVTLLFSEIADNAVRGAALIAANGYIHSLTI